MQMNDDKSKMRCGDIFEQVVRMMENFKQYMQRRQLGGPPVPPQVVFAMPPAIPAPVHLPHNHLSAQPQPPQAGVHNLSDMAYRNAGMHYQPPGPVVNKVGFPGAAGVQAAPALIGGPHGIAAAAPPPSASDEFLQTGDLSKLHISKDVEEEANLYFQKIYNQQMVQSDSIQNFLDMLRR